MPTYRGYESTTNMPTKKIRTKKIRTKKRNKKKVSPKGGRRCEGGHQVPGTKAWARF